MKKFTYEETNVFRNASGRLEWSEPIIWEFWTGREDHFMVSRNGTAKTVKVVPNSDYVYKLLKTHIKAQGGAAGLVDFLQKDIKDGGQAWPRKVLHHAFYDCKSIH